MDKKEEIKDKLIKFAFGFIAAIIAGVLIGLVSRGGEPNTYKQNKTVKFEGLEYTITKVEKHQAELYEDYNELKVTLKIKNTTKETIDYSTWNFSITNKKGEEIAKSGLVNDDGTYLKDGSLAPGEEVEGALSWNVKKDATDLRIMYRKNMFNSEYDFQWALDN